jgi:uncharacterized lipoprotein YajG
LIRRKILTQKNSNARMIQLEIANINLLERIKKGQVNFMKKKITAILMVILIGIMAAGCGQQQKTEQTEGTEESASQDIFAMDTYMSVTAYGADAESATGCTAFDRRDGQ